MPLAALCLSGTATADVLPDSITVKQSARVLWDFESNSQGWTTGHSISGLSATHGCLRGTVSGTDPFVYDPNPRKMSIRGAAGVAVRVWLSQTGPLQLYWENEDGVFSAARGVTWSSVPGQQWTTVRFDLSANPEWVGKTISRIRLDPGAPGAVFAIDYVALVYHLAVPGAALVSKVFDFTATQPDWTASGNVTDYVWEDGKLKGKSRGIDPFVISPAVSLTGQGGVLVQAKANFASAFKLYWETSDAPGFSEARSKKIDLTADPDWRLLKFDLRDNPGWAGKTITRLRIDPCSIGGENFEIDSVLVLGNEGFEDTDGDLLDGLEELARGTDPAQRTGLPGRLTYERWNGTDFDSTRQLVAEHSFYGKPDVVRWGVPDAPAGFYQTNFFSIRARGYLTAPETGYYRFWISGDSGMELYLSEDATKYRKHRIAELNPEIGTGYGVPVTTQNLWDNFTSQMSGEVYLTQGSKYYMEMLQTTGHTGLVHAGIAWAKPGADREPLDVNQVESYSPTADDAADDDCLPDAWEVQYGLDPADNGFVDILRQGERGDFDSDGLTNLEEYVFGTDPGNPDTDGDGLTDSAEVHSYHTNPTASDAPSGQIIGTLDLSAYTAADSPWTLTSQGLIPSSFRSSISWNFTVPGDGYWLLDVATTLMGDLRAEETVNVGMLIDGVSIGESTLIYGPDHQALLRVFTPHLTAGNHSIGLRIDNAITRRMVTIRSISVIRPEGADLNSDGIPDWVVSQLQGEDTLRPYQPTSRTSPANLEGTARTRAAVTLNGNPVLAGMDRNHWYANLPLDENYPTNFTLSLEQGLDQTGAIDWQDTNTLTAQTIIVRKGDSLKLVAQPAGGPTGQPATLSFGPWNWNGTPGAAGTYDVQLASDTDHYIYTLADAGTYKVTGTHADGTQATIAIVVKHAEFPATPEDFLANTPGAISYLTSAVDTSLYFEAGQSAAITNPGTISGSGSDKTLTLAVSPQIPGPANMIARLQQDGPILGVQPLDMIGLSDVLQNDSSFTYQSMDFPGYQVIRSPIVVTDLPEGATVVITIFRAGVTFLDGSKTLTLSAGDFINGVYNLQFLFPAGINGGYCHYIDIYDRNGNYLGRR